MSKGPRKKAQRMGPCPRVTQCQLTPGRGGGAFAELKLTLGQK